MQVQKSSYSFYNVNNIDYKCESPTCERQLFKDDFKILNFWKNISSWCVCVCVCENMKLLEGNSNKDLGVIGKDSEETSQNLGPITQHKFSNLRCFKIIIFL